MKTNSRNQHSVPLAGRPGVRGFAALCILIAATLLSTACAGKFKKEIRALELRESELTELDRLNTLDQQVRAMEQQLDEIAGKQAAIYSYLKSQGANTSRDLSTVLSGLERTEGELTDIGEQLSELKTTSP